MSSLFISSNADSSENTYFEELSEEQINYVLTDAKKTCT